MGADGADWDELGARTSHRRRGKAPSYAPVNVRRGGFEAEARSRRRATRRAFRSWCEWLRQQMRQQATRQTPVLHFKL